MILKIALSRINDIMAVGFRKTEEADAALHLVAEAVPAEIDLPQLRQRSRDYLVGHYLGLHITVVSVSLALAGGAAASLMTRPSDTAADLVQLWLLWLGSVLATAVAYAGTMVGAFALPSGIPDVSDLALPLLMCVVEFLLFAVLIRQVTSFASLSALVSTWFVLMAVFAAIAWQSITRARHHFTLAAETADEEAAVVIRRYTKYLDRDRIGAGATSAVGAIAAIVRLSGGTAIAVAYLFVVAVILLLAAGLIGHAQTARMWRLRLYPRPAEDGLAGGQAEHGPGQSSRQRSQEPQAATEPSHAVPPHDPGAGNEVSA